MSANGAGGLSEGETWQSRKWAAGLGRERRIADGQGAGGVCWASAVFVCCLWSSVFFLRSISAFRLPSFRVFFGSFVLCFLFFCSALRVPPAEIRLTVYRRLNILLHSDRPSLGSREDR